jgi:hypothetical protein
MYNQSQKAEETSSVSSETKNKLEGFILRGFPFWELDKVDKIHNHLMSRVSQFPHKIGNAAFSRPVIKNPLATKILIISLWSFGASTIFISCREESACCEKSQCRQTLDITWTDRSRLKLWRCHLYTTPEKESTCAKSSVFTIHNFCCKRISY